MGASSGAGIAEELWTSPRGATMREVIEATGGPQYNKLKALESRGYAVRKVKEGGETRYFVTPPAERSFEATVTSQGQITIPKEIREFLRVRNGGKLRLVIESDDRVAVTPVNLSVQRLFGMLGTPPRTATVEEMDTAVRKAAARKYLKAGR